jgi:adenine C2-methylase RlmN of 23S rRNA A2503 and tRNA A37
MGKRKVPRPELVQRYIELRDAPQADRAKLGTVRLTRGNDIETACGQLAAAPRARVAAAT